MKTRLKDLPRNSPIAIRKRREYFAVARDIDKTPMPCPVAEFFSWLLRSGEHAQ